MVESPSFTWCKDCPLPSLMKKIESSRNAAQIANSNILTSESPAQAQPYQQEAQAQTANLKETLDKLNKFVASGKKCQACSL
jgi:hypothetical protein